MSKNNNFQIYALKWLREPFQTKKQGNLGKGPKWRWPLAGLGIFLNFGIFKKGFPPLKSTKDLGLFWMVYLAIFSTPIDKILCFLVIIRWKLIIVNFPQLKLGPYAIVLTKDKFEKYNHTCSKHKHTYRSWDN